MNVSIFYLFIHCKKLRTAVSANTRRTSAIVTYTWNRIQYIIYNIICIYVTAGSWQISHYSKNVPVAINIVIRIAIFCFWDGFYVGIVPIKIVRAQTGYCSYIATHIIIDSRQSDLASSVTVCLQIFYTFRHVRVSGLTRFFPLFVSSAHCIWRMREKIIFTRRMRFAPAPRQSYPRTTMTIVILLQLFSLIEIHRQLWPFSKHYL
jgi:hypothetical protein